MEAASPRSPRPYFLQPPAPQCSLLQRTQKWVRSRLQLLIAVGVLIVAGLLSDDLPSAIKRASAPVQQYWAPEDQSCLGETKRCTIAPHFSSPDQFVAAVISSNSTWLILFATDDYQRRTGASQRFIKELFVQSANSLGVRFGTADRYMDGTATWGKNHGVDFEHALQLFRGTPQTNQYVSAKPLFRSSVPFAAQSNSKKKRTKSTDPPHKLLWSKIESGDTDNLMKSIKTWLKSSVPEPSRSALKPLTEAMFRAARSSFGPNAQRMTQELTDASNNPNRSHPSGHIKPTRLVVFSDYETPARFFFGLLLTFARDVTFHYVHVDGNYLEDHPGLARHFGLIPDSGQGHSKSTNQLLLPLIFLCDSNFDILKQVSAPFSFHSIRQQITAELATEPSPLVIQIASVCGSLLVLPLNGALHIYELICSELLHKRLGVSLTVRGNLLSLALFAAGVLRQWMVRRKRQREEDNRRREEHRLMMERIHALLRNDLAWLDELFDRRDKEEIEQRISSLRPKPVSKGQLSLLQQSKQDTCAICQIDYECGSSCTETACRHVFHHECLSTWAEQSGLCPLCRQTFWTPTLWHKAKAFVSRMHTYIDENVWNCSIAWFLFCFSVSHCVEKHFR